MTSDFHHSATQPASRSVHRKRMCFVVDFFQALGGKVGVDLRGRQARMPQQFLDAPEIRSSV